MIPIDPRTSGLVLSRTEVMASLDVPALVGGYGSHVIPSRLVRYSIEPWRVVDGQAVVGGVGGAIAMDIGMSEIQEVSEPALPSDDVGADASFVPTTGVTGGEWVAAVGMARTQHRLTAVGGAVAGTNDYLFRDGVSQRDWMSVRMSGASTAASGLALPSVSWASGWTLLVTGVVHVPRGSRCVLMQAGPASVQMRSDGMVWLSLGDFMVDGYVARVGESRSRRPMTFGLSWDPDGMMSMILMDDGKKTTSARMRSGGAVSVGSMDSPAELRVLRVDYFEGVFSPGAINRALSGIDAIYEVLR